MEEEEPCSEAGPYGQTVRGPPAAGVIIGVILVMTGVVHSWKYMITYCILTYEIPILHTIG